MTTSMLEARVARLETELVALQRVIRNVPAETVPWWEQISGTFADVPAFDEVVRLGQQYRQTAPVDDVPREGS